MDFTSFLKLLAILKEYGAFEITVIGLLLWGQRSLKIHLRRQRYTELNVTSMNYSLEKNLNSKYMEPRDEMLERLMKKEQFVMEKK